MAARDLFGGPRTLAYTLPVGPGDRVLILGAAPTVAQSVARRGADPISVVPPTEHADRPQLVGTMAASEPGEDLPLESESVDHAIVPSAGAHGVPTVVLPDVARVLRPGGGLFFGVAHRWRSPTNTRAWTVARGRRVLRAAGFRDVEAYGVRYSVFSPRFLVPIEDSAAVNWFLTSMCMPLSAREAVALAVLARAPSRRAAFPLFPDLGFLARRAGKPG
jgi:SAM-dependent methyltransferase